VKEATDLDQLPERERALPLEGGVQFGGRDIGGLLNNVDRGSSVPDRIVDIGADHLGSASSLHMESMTLRMENVKHI